MDRRERPRVARLLRAAACVAGGFVAGISLWVGLIHAGVLESPFGPTLRGDIELARGERDGLRVLFVGNSLTYYNDMPRLVEELAAADRGAQPIFAVWYTAPGWTLQEASADDELETILEDGRWDAVVLQEQSGLASASLDVRRRETEPYALELLRSIAGSGARPLLYMTWHSRAPTDLAAELALPAVPVAPAWDEARRRRPALDLLASDGLHPNRAGSYLAACVFYAALTGRDSAASTFAAGLPSADARFLRVVADDVIAGWS